MNGARVREIKEVAHDVRHASHPDARDREFSGDSPYAARRALIASRIRFPLTKSNERRWPAR